MLWLGYQNNKRTVFYGYQSETKKGISPIEEVEFKLLLYSVTTQR